MNVLVIGGTAFAGRHLTDALLRGGHTVTLFNRGLSGAPASGTVEQVHGDRKSDLARLDGRTFDAVVDMCGYTPDGVERSARYFANRTDRYLFVSTISVYDNEGLPQVDETSPVLRLPASVDRTKLDLAHYGALKALCEAVVRSTYRHRAAIVRPGLIVGPYDRTDRYTYWPLRIAQGGEVLAPVGPSEPVQYIDARDLAAFIVRLVETGASGTYNAVSPPGTFTIGDVFDACTRAAGSKPRFVWAPADWLEAHNVEAWNDLPLWVPAGPDRGMVNVQARRALVAGLTIRPALETARDTLAWALGAGKRLETLKAGLRPERETELRAELTAALK